MPTWHELEAFGGLRKGEKFTMDKAVILRTEVGKDQGGGSTCRVRNSEVS